MNKQGMGVTSIILIIIGILGIVFIFKTGLISDFFNYIKELFFGLK